MPLETRDRVIVALLVAFSAFNAVLDLPLVLSAGHLGQPGADGALARLWGIYADADRFWIVGPWSLAQEGINVLAATALNIWLVVAILRRRPYRHVLQLALGSYLSYSVVLYYLAGHLSGYAGMRSRSAYTFGLFYGLSLPWLLAHLYLAYDSAVAITRRFAATPMASPRRA